MPDGVERVRQAPPPPVRTVPKVLCQLWFFVEDSPEVQCEACSWTHGRHLPSRRALFLRSEVFLFPFSKGGFCAAGLIQQ